MGDGAPFHQHFKELIFSGISLPVIKKNLVICVLCFYHTAKLRKMCSNSSDDIPGSGMAVRLTVNVMVLQLPILFARFLQHCMNLFFIVCQRFWFASLSASLPYNLSFRARPWSSVQSSYLFLSLAKFSK